MRKIFILTKMLYISASFAQDGKVGINTTNPSETLEVAGTAKIKELPQNNQGNIYGGNSQKGTPFSATRTVVADDNGVLGYVVGTPQDIDTNTTYTAGKGIIIDENQEISRSGVEAVYRTDGKKGWRLIDASDEYHDEIGAGSLDLTVNNIFLKRKEFRPTYVSEYHSVAKRINLTPSSPYKTIVKPGTFGNLNIAIGSHNSTEGAMATAIGLYNYSLSYGLAMGQQNTSINGVAIGHSNYAEDQGSTAIGKGNFAYDLGSVSLGDGNGSFGGGIAIGTGNASGSYGTAIGFENTAKGRESFGIGYKTEAVSHGATALGIHTRANIYGQLVAGFFNFNTDNDDHDSKITYSRDEKEIFVLGNGLNDFEKLGNNPDPTKFERQNAFIVLRNGKTGIGVPKRKPKEMLEVAGAVKIDDGGYRNISNGATTPEPNGGAGTIIFQNGHFFGWNGTEWKQLDN